MNFKIIKILLVIYLFNWYIKFIECYQIKGTCHSCIWVKYKFPSKTECIYYQKYSEVAIRNCTAYHVSHRLLKKSV